MLGGVESFGEGKNFCPAFLRQIADGLLPAGRRRAVPRGVRPEPRLSDRRHGIAKPFGQFGVRNGAEQGVGSGSEIH